MGREGAGAEGGERSQQLPGPHLREGESFWFCCLEQFNWEPPGDLPHLSKPLFSLPPRKENGFPGGLRRIDAAANYI